MLRPALLPQLSVFQVVARLRSFSAAARELGVSPSAVSQSIRQLEEALRVVLFTRTTRRVALSGPGRRLAESAGLVAEQVQRAEDLLPQPQRQRVDRPVARVERGSREQRPPVRLNREIRRTHRLPAAITVEARSLLALQLEEFEQPRLFGGGSHHMQLAGRPGKQ